MVKLNVFTLLPGLALAACGRAGRRGVVAWAVGFAATFGGIALACGPTPAAAGDALLSPHVGGGGSWRDNAADGWSNLLDNDLPMLAAAGLSLVLAALTPTRPGGLAVPALAAAWLVTSLIALLMANPVWYHHVTLLTVPLSVLAAAGVGRAVVVLGERPLTRLGPLAVCVLVAAAVGCAGAGVRLSRDLDPGGRTAERRYDAAAVAAIAAAPPGPVYADWPMYALLAGRLPMPEVAVPSMKRRRGGRMGDAMLADLIDRRRPPVVVIGRYHHGPRVRALLDADYDLAHAGPWIHGWRPPAVVHVRRPDAGDSP